MEQRIAHFKDTCPQVDPGFIEDHFHRLDDRYFRTFTDDAIAVHLRKCSSLTPGSLFDLTARFSGNQVSCTLFAFNFPGAFSLLAGTLSAMGLDIVSGDSFTYKKSDQESQVSSLRKTQKRLIIDHFQGTLPAGTSPDSWEDQLRQQLTRVFTLLDRENPDARREARKLVNEWVAESLSRINFESGRVLLPARIEVDNTLPAVTRLHIFTEDTPFFLYALTAAMASRRVSLERIIIRTHEGEIHDEIDLVDNHGSKLLDTRSINQVKLSVLLTKQFTYFLDEAPDPNAAFERFETLVEDVADLKDQQRWLDMLADPEVMRELAKLLGASDYL